ncbi:hypothetical protein FIBSPDRAFT_793232 [Athelia psychrophila]|uniref:THIF-type NAD/FAD binding fold domain-containing protein n=1 Tax=Athelia psychrophila TaxID=1759441 RepID=A0A166G1Y9_9AGAM|nr:hypothetical protein FIBSPDRAFT_793232 [Fibularhizoctonia sp. CBS 109695]
MNTLSLQSHRTQLIATAAVASLTTLTLSTVYSSYTKRQKRRTLDREIRDSISALNEDRDEAPSPLDVYDELGQSRRNVFQEKEPASVPNGAVYDEELIREQLARNYTFFGEEGMRKIRGGRVVVVGCGGVGSWAAVMLVRSGVSNIRLVDFDYVTLSSLNRHATALLSDVGTPKVKCIERTLKQISRWVTVDARIDIWRAEEGGKLLEGADWVIDAIDNITTKVDLLKYCHAHSTRVFSSMGAGAKNDPTRVQIADISNTIYDPLARSVRRRLRVPTSSASPSPFAGSSSKAETEDWRSAKVTSGIPVVYSTEVPGDVKLLPLPDEEFAKGAVKELGVFDDFRVRVLPVLGPLPAIFGLHIATYILCELAGKPIANPLPIKNRRKLYERMGRELLHREMKIAGAVVNKLSIDDDDISLLFEDVHRGRSLIPPHPVPTRPALVRWDPALPLALDNCVVMESAEADKHMRECFGVVNAGADSKGEVEVDVGPTNLRRPEELWGAEVAGVFERRKQEVGGQRDWVM